MAQLDSYPYIIRSSAPRVLPIHRSPDRAILNRFKGGARAVVWERTQPDNIRSYVHDMTTVYRNDTVKLDGLVVALDIVSAGIEVIQVSKKPKMLGHWGDVGKRLEISKLLPGTEEEKGPLLQDLVTRARDAEETLADWKMSPDQKIRMQFWTETGFRERHTHPFPVYHLNYSNAGTIVDDKDALPVHSAAIVGKDVFHNSPSLPAGELRVYAALFYPV